MRKASKLFSILMALIMLLSLAIAAAEEEEAEPEYPDELRVGHTTELKGDFFTEMFGNNTADIDVRALLHRYNLVNWDQNQGVYLIDESVVESWMIEADEVGNKYFFLGLYDDLYFSDGTPITAWDYAFSLLLMMSPQIEEIGGKIYRAEHILGYNEYITGELPYLSGVGVIDDHQLVITLDHNFLPYFFETGLLLCSPYPIHEIAPGCKVYAGAAEQGGTQNGYGFGIYIGNEDPSVTEPIYTAELLEKTILDPETGYNSHPKVVSGPYRLVDFDGEVAHFESNEYYKGAWVHNTLPDRFNADESMMTAGSGSQINRHDGPNYYKTTKIDRNGEETEMTLVKPTIEKISFQLTDNNTMKAELADGELHLVNKVTYGPLIYDLLGTRVVDTIEEEMEEGELLEVETSEHLAAQMEEEEGTDDETEKLDLRFQSYPRIGLSFLTFTYEWPAVHDKEVRQAIAWCMDRDGLTQDYTSGLGQVVDGYYGIEQWEYLICKGMLDYPINFLGDEEHTEEDLAELAKHRNMNATTEEEYEALEAAWRMLNLDNLTHYEVNIDRANVLLDSARWTLNRQGETYDPEKDDVRCKMINGQLVALDLTMMYPEGNHIVDTIEERFLDNLAQVGIKITLVPEKMDELLRSYYRETERTTDMIYLATNFHIIVDPSITYSTDKTANHQIWNNTYSDDEDLYYRAVNMRQTDPQDVYDYVSKWISFQERYNEVLPTIPIYSNLYFDFYTPELQNYYISGHVTWSQAILQSFFGEEAASLVDSMYDEEEEMEVEGAGEEDEDLEEFED